MFGYVTTNRDELKIKDDKKYRQYYCGLCRSLKQDHGSLSQLTLNNDLTFVYILLSSLYEPDESLKQIRCAMHPIHKHDIRLNQYRHYASDMTIVLSYYKCDDDVLDDHSHSKAMMRQLLKHQFKDVKKKYPQKLAAIEQSLDKIHHLEQINCQDIDDISCCFGEVMGHILAYQDDVFFDDLYHLGFYLGKFIYLIDAYEDIEEDIEKNHYNPFKDKYLQDDFDDYCFSILEMMISECCVYFEKLPLIENIDILRNILYSGIWLKYDLVKNKRMEKNNESL